jgi:hypothetical protein
MDNKVFTKDYEYGKTSENVELELFKNYFDDDTLELNKDKYGSFDYVGEVVNVELKTRRISYNQSIKYGDLIFSYSKYQKWLQNKKTSYIVWKLTDAMVYWKLDEINDNWITKDPFRCDGNERNSTIIHIPMKLIKTF